MKLTDLMPAEKWEQLERELHDRSGMDACVYDTEGNSITAFKVFPNNLCKTIKSYPQGITAICALASQYFTEETRKSENPFIDECDAGLVKFSVPIFYKDQFLGTVSGCGHCFPDGEPDTFLIQKALGKEESELEQMTEGIKTVSEEDVEALIAFVRKRLKEITALL